MTANFRLNLSIKSFNPLINLFKPLSNPEINPFTAFIPRFLHHSAVKIGATFFPHQTLIFAKHSFSLSRIKFQFGAIDVARPIPPAIKRPMPRGTFAPLNARIAPRTISAPLTNAVTAPIGPCIAVSMESQFTAASVASPIAPASISPIPNGMFAPVKAKIAPKTRSAALTIATTFPIGPSSAFSIEFQFRATVAASPIAPAIKRPIPSAGLAPEKVIIAPNTSKAALTSPIIIPICDFMVLVMVSQFAATTAANPTAPAIIRPIPRGMFVPLNTSRIPIARRAVLTIATISPRIPCKSVEIAPQFVLTASQIAIAPITISPIPRGIFAPENVNIAPSAKSAAPVNNSKIALRESSITPLKSGLIPPEAFPPPDPDPVSVES